MGRYNFDFKRYKDWEAKAKLLGTYEDYEMTTMFDSYSGDVPYLVKYKGKKENLHTPPVYAIGPGAFIRNQYIKNITFDTNNYVIREGAFTGCYNLESFSIEADSCIFERRVFFDCTNLKRADFGDCKCSISINMLGNCKKLADIKMKNIYNIKNRAFCGCIELNKIIIPETVREIDKSAFERCYKLSNVAILAENIQITKDLAGVGKQLFDTTDLKELTVKAKLVELFRKEIPCDLIGVKINIL